MTELITILEPFSSIILLTDKLENLEDLMKIAFVLIGSSIIFGIIYVHINDKERERERQKDEKQRKDIEARQIEIEEEIKRINKRLDRGFIPH